MSRRTALLLLVLAAAVAAALWLRSSGGGVPQLGSPAVPDPDPAAPLAGTAGGQDDARQRTPVALASEPAVTARFRVVAADTGTPIAGAQLRSATGGTVLATTDTAGTADLPGHDVTDLVFCAPDALLGFFAMGHPQLPALRAAAARAGFYEIALEPDRWTIPCALRLRSSTGDAPASARIRLTPLDSGSTPGAGAAGAPHEAWSTHVLVSGLPGFHDVPLVVCPGGVPRTLEVGAAVTLRFERAGPHLLEALSSDGEVARLQIAVAPGQGAPAVVALTPGVWATGTVTAADDGSALVDARVRTLRAELGVREAHTDAQGRFRIGPLTMAPHALRLEHRDCEPVTLGPRLPDGSAWDAILPRRPRHVVQGVIRARPGLAAIAGATVATVHDGETEAEATAASDGSFRLVTTAPAPHLVVRAIGFLEYAEAIDPAMPPPTFDLLPDGPAARASAALTAVLRGRVVGPDGTPRPGTPVRLLSEQPYTPVGLAGRRILRGGFLALPEVTMAGNAGEFELECAAAGPARLLVVDGLTSVTDGLTIEVVLGRTTEELRLETRR